MATSVNDTFTDSTGVLLENHTPDTGSTWTKHGSYGSSSLAITAGGRLRNNATATACYYNAADPGADNYDVQVDTYIASLATESIGQAGRIATGANTMYFARWNYSPGNWQLYKIVAGSATSLGSYSQTPSQGETFTSILKLGTNSQIVTVAGVDRITASDSAISARGYAGVREGNSTSRTDSTGFHLDAYSVSYAGVINDAVGSDTIRIRSSTETPSSDSKRMISASVGIGSDTLRRILASVAVGEDTLRRIAASTLFEADTKRLVQETVTLLGDTKRIRSSTESVVSDTLREIIGAIFAAVSSDTRRQIADSVLVLGDTERIIGPYLERVSSDTRRWISAGVGSSYYLSPNGSDTADGSQSTPWKKLSHAMQVVHPGDVLYFRAGTYTENVVWTQSGTPTKPIVLVAFPGETVVLTGQDSTQPNTLTVLTLRGCENVMLYNLRIEGSRARIATDPALPRKQYCLELTHGGGHGVKILNCHLFHGLAGGFRDENGSASYRIAGTLVYNNGLDNRDPAVTIQGTNVVVRGNGILMNAGTGLSAATLMNGLPNSPFVYGNVLFDNHGHGIVTTALNGRFAYNVIHANHLQGVHFQHQYATGNRVQNSLIYENEQYQIGADLICPYHANTVDYCLIAPATAPPWSENSVTDSYDGGHNRFSVPQVLDQANHDYRLVTDAPGDDGAWPITLNGLPRFWPDLGLVPATEYTEPPL